MRLLLSASLLSADMARLRDEMRRVEEAGADLIHVDVMDGHFVPNITLGPVVVRALKRYAARPLDVHIMIRDPEAYADAFLDAGAARLTFHHEAAKDPVALARRIRERGAMPAVSVKPATPIEVLFPYLDEVGMALVMTVEPGFGGQKILPHCLEKVSVLRQKAGDRLDIEVDGGINLDTLPMAVRAGANVFVAGSAIFDSENITGTVREMKRLMAEHARALA